MVAEWVIASTKSKKLHQHDEKTHNGLCELEFSVLTLTAVFQLVKAGLRSSTCLHTSRFLYSDEVQIGPETVMTTLYTAKKYAVPALEAHCVEFLKKNLRADNAFMLLTQVRSEAICISSPFKQVQQLYII